MQELLTTLPALVKILEQAGVIGVLLIVCGVLIWEIRRGREQVHKMRDEMGVVYGQRDKARAISIRYKGQLDNAKITVDISDILLMFPDSKQ